MRKREASAEHRDGKRAVAAATEACKLTDFKNGNSLDTLAAACAEAGQFDEAVRYQEQALDDPAAKNNDGMRRRLELYKSKKAYRAE